MACELCELVAGDVKSRFYYKNKTCTIVDCSTCNIPMVVLNRHGSVSEEEKRLMMSAIDSLFAYESIRTTARQIPEHEHWHIIGAKYLG